ncbi:hypothetical protein PBY51_022114 [Eleginops maclovinus]|uniref:Uncharacterized protein n=1 Tax=Eleginops maclovinus TaxID=56733 RepID=A0AAN8AI16_ELEMC|nr:hypothetical protein PBY51_022114 [Eleginops maclovinus]
MSGSRTATWGPLIISELWELDSNNPITNTAARTNPRPQTHWGAPVSDVFSAKGQQTTRRRVPRGKKDKMK